MEIQRARERLRDLELEFLEKLRRFQQDTGLEVVRVEVDRLVDDCERSVVSMVTIKVGLNTVQPETVKVSEN